MELIIEPTAERLGARVAADLLRICASVPAPLLCPTSGSTPAPLYRALVAFIRQQQIDYSTWRFVGLDEWAGLNGDDPGSCRDFVNQALFRPLQVPNERICFFDGRTDDLHAECRRAETFIQQHGGLTVAVVGLGLNGHVGMNEPGTPASQRTHVAAIAPETQRVGQKYFTAPKELAQGVTLGLGTLLDAQHLFLMATGEAKAAIVKRVLEAKPTDAVPATLLKQHAQLRVYLDEKAAQGIGAGLI